MRKTGLQNELANNHYWLAGIKTRKQKRKRKKKESKNDNVSVKKNLAKNKYVCKQQEQSQLNGE